MEATQTPNPPGLETVWGYLQETDRLLKESAERFERETREGAERQHKFELEMKESAERFERERRENDERFEREMRESAERFEREMRESKADFNKRLGEYINLFGEVTEYTMAPKLREKFAAFGFDFHRTTREINVRDEINGLFFEVDVMLENGDIAMAVEIKTRLTVERINKHIDRLEKIRKYADLRGDRRAFLGAVAGVVVADEAGKYALDKGFYLIEPSGESFSITPPNGKPKEW